MIAYHFVGETLRDGSPVPADGVKLVYPGRPVLCQSGLHASVDPWDALKYAPGPILCRVEVGGTVEVDSDKVVGTERTILERRDATAMLWRFARSQARSVVHLWDAPEVVRRYLESGDETLRDAAWDAANAAARDADRDAVWDAASAAARGAARDAAWAAAARDAAWDAA